MDNLWITEMSELPEMSELSGMSQMSDLSDMSDSPQGGYPNYDEPLITITPNYNHTYFDIASQS